MHPDKAAALGKLAEVSRELDTEIHHLKDVVQHPGRNGWGSSLQAVATLSGLGIGALLVDAVEVFIRRTSDNAWNQ